jgi:hypothetical protein
MQLQKLIVSLILTFHNDRVTTANAMLVNDTMNTQDDTE